jgi:uncharacterized protein
MIRRSGYMNASELFQAWAQACIAKDVDSIANLYCEDATHTFPFREGAPVVEGREAIRQHLGQGFARAPISFSGVEDATVHQTDDPHTVIVECTFAGTVTSNGAVYRPSYVEVLTERDGLIGAVRDYENLAYRAAQMPTQVPSPRS